MTRSSGFVWKDTGLPYGDHNHTRVHSTSAYLVSAAQKASVAIPRAATRRTHAKGHRELAQVQLLYQPLHHLDRDRRPRRDPSPAHTVSRRPHTHSQCAPEPAGIDRLACHPAALHLVQDAQVMCRHAVQRGAALVDERVDDGGGRIRLGGVDDARAVRPRCEIP